MWLVNLQHQAGKKVIQKAHTSLQGKLTCRIMLGIPHSDCIRLIPTSFSRNRVHGTHLLNHHSHNMCLSHKVKENSMAHSQMTCMPPPTKARHAAVNKQQDVPLIGINKTYPCTLHHMDFQISGTRSRTKNRCQFRLCSNISTIEQLLNQVSMPAKASAAQKCGYAGLSYNQVVGQQKCGSQQMIQRSRAEV